MFRNIPDHKNPFAGVATNKQRYADWQESIQEWLVKWDLEHIFNWHINNGGILYYFLEANPKCRNFSPQEWEAFWASPCDKWNYPTPFDVADSIKKWHEVA